MTTAKQRKKVARERALLEQGAKLGYELAGAMLDRANIPPPAQPIPLELFDFRPAVLTELPAGFRTLKVPK